MILSANLIACQPCVTEDKCLDRASSSTSLQVLWAWRTKTFWSDSCTQHKLRQMLGSVDGMGETKNNVFPFVIQAKQP